MKAIGFVAILLCQVIILALKQVSVQSLSLLNDLNGMYRHMYMYTLGRGRGNASYCGHLVHFINDIVV